VIIEASTHKVHLRQANTLTFDATGSSRPLDAIAGHLARYLDVPFAKADCGYLVGRRRYRDKQEEEDRLKREKDAGERSSSVPKPLKSLVK